MFNRINEKYGRLLIINEGKTIKYNNCTHKYAICKCDCGNILEVQINSLRSGSTKSCGCLTLERLTKHGQTSNGNISSIYNIWHGMIQRCKSVNNKDYDRYGGRGISVCDRWINSFENFYTDMGPKPSPEQSIDRINNDGNYEPGNCRWATAAEQAKNRKNNVFVEYNGFKKTIPEWSTETGVPISTIRYRLKNGISIQTALIK